MKEVKVIPMFKIGDKLLMSNYRQSQSSEVFQKYLKKLFIKDYFLFLINIRFYHKVIIVLGLNLILLMLSWVLSLRRIKT